MSIALLDDYSQEHHLSFSCDPGTNVTWEKHGQPWRWVTSALEKSNIAMTFPTSKNREELVYLLSQRSSSYAKLIYPSILYGLGSNVYSDGLLVAMGWDIETSLIMSSCARRWTWDTKEEWQCEILMTTRIFVGGFLVFGFNSQLTCHGNNFHS